VAGQSFNAVFSFPPTELIKVNRINISGVVAESTSLLLSLIRTSHVAGKKENIPLSWPKMQQKPMEFLCGLSSIPGDNCTRVNRGAAKRRKKYKIAEGIKWKYPVPISIAMSNPLFSIQRQLSDCRVGFRVSIPVFSSANVFSKILLPLYGAGF